MPVPGTNGELVVISAGLKRGSVQDKTSVVILSEAKNL